MGPGALPVPKHARLRHDNSSPRGRWGAYPVLGVHVLDRCLGHCMASMHPCREYGLGLLARAHVPGAWARALTRTHVFWVFFKLFSFLENFFSVFWDIF